MNNNSVYEISQNPFESLAVDITNRCNMTCHFCWNPNRVDNDMNIADFERLCRTLPKPVLLKLMGGEPTLHPDLLDFLRIAYNHHHKVTVVSNGLKFADRTFTSSLKELHDEGIRFSLTISLDGGIGNYEAYRIINGDEKYLDMKRNALQTLLDYKLNRICLTAMIVRGVNENSVRELVQLAKNNDKYIRYIHFRNAAKIGRWSACAPYSFTELKKLASTEFTEEEWKPNSIGEICCPANRCCYRFRPSKRLQISIIDFASENAFNCPKRGRYSLFTKKIQQFFVSMEERKVL